MVEQQLAQALRRAGRRRRRRPRGSRRASSSVSRSARPVAVADHRSPAGRLDDRGVGVTRESSRSIQNALVPAGEQSIGVGVQAGERSVGVAGPRATRARGRGRPPRRGGRAPGRACGRGSTSTTFAGGRQHVGEQLAAVGRRRPATAASSPCRRRARPRRGAPTARGPTARSATSCAARSRTSAVGISSRAGKMQTSSRSSVLRWSLTPNVGEPVDLVAPQVDADRGVGGGREDVDDRAAAGELAAVLDQLLAAVAELDEPALTARRGRSSAPGRTMIGSTVGASGTELLQQRPHAGDDDGGDALGVTQPPQHLEALAHRLDARADPLERQRLPAGEQHDLVGGQELARGRRPAGPPSCRSGRRRPADGWTTARRARRSRSAGRLRRRRGGRWGRRGRG